MPTREQLMLMREAEMEFPHTRRDDDPMKPPMPKPITEFTGEVIGEIKADPETKELVTIPNKDQ